MIAFFIVTNVGRRKTGRTHNDRRWTDVLPAGDFSPDTGDDAQVQYKKGNLFLYRVKCSIKCVLLQRFTMNELSNLNVWSSSPCPLIGRGVQHVPDLPPGRLHRS